MSGVGVVLVAIDALDHDGRPAHFEDAIDDRDIAEPEALEAELGVTAIDHHDLD